MKNAHDNLIRLSFGIALLILVFIGGLVYWTTNSLIETNAKALDTYQVLEKLNGLLAGIYNGESSARGFMMSEDPRDFDSYRTAAAEVQDILAVLDSMYDKNPEQKARLESLKSAVNKKIEFSDHKLELRKSQGFKSSLDFFLTGRDQTLMNKIASITSEMKSEEVRILQRRRTRADLNAKRLRVSLILGLSLSFCMFLAVYSYLNHEVRRRRQAEAEAIKLNEGLELRVNERTAELADVNRQLELRNEEVEHANRMKSEFLARMSHELRTPLNSIIGFSDLLAEESKGPLNDKQKRFINHVSAGARHLLQLINDILDVSKIEAGKIEFNPADFTVSDAIHEVLSVITPLADSKKIGIDNAVGKELELWGDRVRIKQIFYNLLTNAVKFTPEGGQVRIEAFRETDFVRFSVSDTGIGIPPDEQRLIFEEFHQAGGTTKNPNQGTGLGLTITKRLVELHGGEIWAESSPGQGSRFIFTIPATPGN
jgi:signal transduction histidine kinase